MFKELVLIIFTIYDYINCIQRIFLKMLSHYKLIVGIFVVIFK